jgi:osmoprotectant transport system permease protein
MVTALALILDAALAFAVWASLPGSGRLRKFRRMPQPLLSDEVALESGPIAHAPSRLRSSFAARHQRRILRLR